MKKLLTLALWLLASSVAAEQVSGTVLLRYNLNTTSMIYCAVTGGTGAVLGAPVPGPARVATAGASTTISAETALTYPFASLAVGDIIVVDGNIRTIVTWTDADTIVVDEAVTLAGNTFVYYKLHCGTAATDGWFPVANLDVWGIGFEIDQVDLTGGIDIRLECKTDSLGSDPVQVFPPCPVGACNTVENFAGVAGITSRIVINTDITWASQCRLGMKINTADDGVDTTTHAERIDVYLSGVR